MSEDKSYLFDINTSTLIVVTHEQERAIFLQWAAQLTTVFGAPIAAIDPDEIDSAGYTGFLVKQTATHRIEIHRMLVNWRLATVPIGQSYPVPDRFWCYRGLDTVSLILALTAALEWDGAGDTEPKGWTRNGQASLTNSAVAGVLVSAWLCGACCQAMRRHCGCIGCERAPYGSQSRPE